MRTASFEEDEESFSSRMLEDEYGDLPEEPASPQKQPQTASLADDVRWSPIGSTALVVLCAALIASTGLLTRAAEVDGEVLYDPTAACLFAELGKLSISLSLTAASPRIEVALTPAESRKMMLAFLAPALGYVLVNNIRIHLVQLVDPGLLQLLWNLKIVVIGILYALPPFRRRLSGRQWLGAFILVVGSCAAETALWSKSDSEGNSETGGVVGVGYVLMTLLITSASAVACEYAYKVVPTTLARQNVVLYSYGAMANFTVYVFRRKIGPFLLGNTMSKFHLTAGFTQATWFAIFAQAFAGFAVGAVFKFVDSVAQVFADVIAMIIAATVSHYFFGLTINYQYLSAMAACTVALCVYYSEGMEKVFVELRSNYRRRTAAALKERHTQDVEEQEPYWETRSALVVQTSTDKQKKRRNSEIEMEPTPVDVLLPPSSDLPSLELNNSTLHRRDGSPRAASYDGSPRAAASSSNEPSSSGSAFAV